MTATIGLPGLATSDAWTCSAEPTAVWMHPWLRAKLGVAEQHGDPTSVMSRIDTRSLARIGRQVQAAAQGRMPIIDESFHALLPDESVQPLRVIALMDAPRQQLTVVFSEATPKPSLCDELQRVQSLLDERTADLEQLVYMASHDLRAPMRQVVQWLGAARRATEPERARMAVAHAFGSARHAMNLHEELVAFLRAHQDDAFNAQTVQVEAIARDAWTRLDAPPSFMLDLTDARCIGHCSPLTLLGVLRSLMSNAVVHHHRNAGTVRVRAWVDDGLHIVVEDDGPGLDMAQRNTAVQLFGRLKPSQDGGSGLGLAVVSRAAYASGGMAWLKNLPQGGLSVHVTLRDRPRSQEPAMQFPASLAQEG